MPQEMTAAGPAAVTALLAPKSQPEPMIEPTEAHMRPTRPTWRLSDRWVVAPVPVLWPGGEIWLREAMGDLSVCGGSGVGGARRVATQ